MSVRERGCPPPDAGRAIADDDTRRRLEAERWASGFRGRGLGPTERELLRLRDEERLDFEAIAGRMGLPSSESALKRHMRAVNRLRLILGAVDENG